MAFTEAQLKSLEAKLDGKRIKTREQNGATLSYLEGWHVIAEANRIFGYDAWDRRTRANACVWSEPTPQSGRLQPSAIHSVSLCMIMSRVASANRAPTKNPA